MKWINLQKEEKVKEENQPKHQNWMNPQWVFQKNHLEGKVRSLSQWGWHSSNSIL